MKMFRLFVAFTLIFFALSPSARSVVPAPDGGYPGFTTAEGNSALQNLTTGVGNTATGWRSLFANAAGNLNTAIGAGTLLLNTGDNNTATGALALLSNTIGNRNTANGTFALSSNSNGLNNTAIGYQALMSNLGSSNTAIGAFSLLGNTAGDDNTAVGADALSSATGNFNIGIGVDAGSNLTTGHFNIDIDNAGVAGEGGTIRIGDQNHTAIYVAGIAGQTVGMGGSTCFVDNDGKLGVFLSARRYKEKIQPMNNVSSALFSLKPVTFCYKPEFDKSGTPHFGLIAEEVAEVAPDLVTHDGKGQLSTVRYEAVNVMLLNEFLKEHKKVEEQQAMITRLKAEMRATTTRQQKQIDALTAGLQKVSAQLKLNKPAPQTVLNDR